jgi:hypothetical protein
MNTNTDTDTGDTDTATVADTQPVGKFFQTLTRNNKTIKQDRALSIVEDAEVFYKREIEDMEHQIRKLARDRNSMIDLSPSSKDDLSFSNFDGKRFVMEHLAISVQIENLKLKLEILKKGYTELFV